jgi:hypothetical protein
MHAEIRGIFIDREETLIMIVEGRVGRTGGTLG